MTQHFTEEQIRALVPHGVWRDPEDSLTEGRWVPFVQINGVLIEPAAHAERLSPAQLTELLNGCECGGRGYDMHAGRKFPCPKCSELRTLLLKLAGEGVESGP